MTDFELMTDLRITDLRMTDFELMTDFGLITDLSQ